MRASRIPLYLSLVLTLGACSTLSGTLGGMLGNDEDTGTEASQQEQKQVQTAAAAGDLEIAWGVDVDQRRPLTPNSYARPVVAGDLIVLAGQDRYAHIYDMQGNELRRVGLQAASDSGALAMSDHLVVLGDAQGILYGIDPQAGSKLWQWQMPSPMLGHPVRAGSDILVQTGDNSIYRISPEGKKLWSFSSAQAGLSMNLSPSPLVDGDTSYAVLSNGDVVALRTESGDLVWRRQLLLDNDAVVLSELKTPLADPVLIGDVLITSFYQGDLVALSALDGQQLWLRNLSLKSAPLVVDERLFVSTADSAVLELDPASGASMWKRQVGSSDTESGELVGPTLLGDSLLVANDHGTVSTLDMNGNITRTLNLPGRVDRKPVAVPGGVLLRNNLGGLYFIR